jgi:hypothetical protein
MLKQPLQKNTVRKWLDDPDLLKKMKDFLNNYQIHVSINSSTLENHDSSDYTEELFEEVAKLLVHPRNWVRMAAITFFSDLLSDSNSILITEGNLIDELPTKVRKAVIAHMITNYQNASENYLQFATFWLGMFGDESSLPFLIKNLDHRNPRIVIQVINALGIYGSPRAIPYLLPLVHNPQLQPKIRQSAIAAVGVLGEEGIGLQSLIHELYKVDSVDYQDLESYLHSHGARILKYLACELEYEKISLRKSKLTSFYTRVAEEFSVENSKHYNILL